MKSFWNRPEWVSLDIEATSLDTSSAAITEVGAVRWRQGVVSRKPKLVGRYSSLFNPGVPISPEVTELTGITQEMVNKAPAWDPRGLQEFIGNTPVVGHNISAYDAPILRRHGISFSGGITDTLTMAKSRGVPIGERSQGAIAASMGINTGNAHRALDDALTNAHIMNTWKGSLFQNYWKKHWGKTLAVGGLVGIGGLLWSARDRQQSSRDMEGLRHGGMAGQLRRQNTDFGSGWRGLFGSLAIWRTQKFMATGAIKGGKFINPKAAARMARKSTFEEFAEGLGVRVFGIGKKYKDDLIQDVALSRKEIAGYLPTSDVAYINKPELIKRYGSDENVLKTAVYHEYLEKMTTRRYGNVNALNTADAQHQGAQVLLGEGAFLGFLGKKDTYNTFKKLRNTRTERNIFGLGVRFSGRDDNFNNIQGLGHRGLAAKLRKLFSDFGSGWDPLRKLFSNYDELIGNPEFIHALTTGRTLKQLGSGSYGTTTLKEATFQGRTFQYAQKEMTGMPDMSLIQQGLGWTQDFTHEMSIMNKLRDTSFAPTGYGVSKDATKLFMEYMPGEQLTTQTAEDLMPAILNAANEMASRGIYHPDLHRGNILKEAGGRLSILDYGLAHEATAITKTDIYIRMSEKAFKLSKPGRPQSIQAMEELINTRQQVRQKLAQHVPVQKEIWDKNNGRRHNRRSSDNNKTKVW